MNPSLGTKMLTLLPATVKRYRVAAKDDPFRSRLTERTIGVNRLDCDWYFDELMAHYRGEVCQAYMVRAARSCLLKEYALSAMYKEAPKHHSHSNLYVRGSDDVIVRTELVPARRHFQLIDDFLTEYKTNEVALPFPSSLIQRLFHYTEGEKLIDVLPLLLHLNPKDNTYFFRHDLTDLPYETFCNLAERMTEEEVRTLTLIPGLPPLPSHSKPVALSHVLAVRHQWAMLSLVLADYPSYHVLLLYCSSAYRDPQASLNTLLEKGVFQDDCGELTDELREELTLYIKVVSLSPERREAFDTGKVYMPCQLVP